MTKIFKIPFATQGDRTAVPDDVQADGSLSYTQGYGYDYERDQATDPAAKDIEREKMNSIFHDITGAVGEIQAFGMPVWAEEGKPYAIRSVVYHNKKAWQSKIENNNTEPAAGVAWTELKADVTAEDVGAYTKVEANLKFQPVGNYADKNEVNGKLAKDQNGADIPNKPKFIENLGLPELLDKKFDKTGGTISGSVEIKSSGGALKLTSTTEGSSNYIEFYGADKRTAYIGYGSDLTTAFTIRNEKTGVTLRVSDAVTVDGYRVITTADTQIPVGGSVIWNSTAPIPDNFWPNEGRSFSAADYPELAKVFPSLKLPDDRGYAIRFADNGKGIDPGRTVGSYQEDAIRNIVGWFGERDFRSPNSDNYISFLWGHSGVFKSEKRMSSEGSSPVMEKASSGNWSGTRFDASLYVPTANENRMKNVAKILITRVK